MESKFTIIVLIILIGILSIVLGVMFGRLTHQFSSNHDEETKIVEIEQTDTIKTEKNDIKEIDPEETNELYKTYLMISIDRNVILHNKKVLDKYGYNSSIIQTKRGEKKIFSLVLDGEYSKPEAQLLGEEIKEKFPTINTYWLEEISKEQKAIVVNESVDIKQKKDEIVEKKEIKKEIKPEIKKPKPKAETPIKQNLYRVQLLANTNKKAIEIKRDILKSNGYETIVSTTVRDGVTFYRLRLDGKYTEKDAKEMGEKVKAQFDFIDGFWLDKIIK